MTTDIPQFPLDPAEIAALIDIPLDQWPGDCHGIADAIRQRIPVAGMRLARGHWNGPVSRRSVYRSGLQQHTWLKLADGRILDPTRWAIVSPDRPFVYLGACDHYDEGARELTSRIPPPFPGSGPDGQALAVERLSDSKRSVLAAHLGMSHAAAWDENGKRRLASNLRHAVHEDTSRLPNAEALYAFLQDHGLRSMIPIDSWMRVMEMDALTCDPRANLQYALPPAKELSEQELLLEVLGHFLRIEERDDFENELAAFGIELEEFWGCLNLMESHVKADIPLSLFPSNKANILCLVAGEHLGQGFGQAMKVERYAESLGYPVQRLAAALKALGDRAGYDLAWDLPEPTPEEPEAINGFSP